MNRLGAVLDMLEHSLGTERKRHIVGGILMSASLLLCGLALTVTSIKNGGQ